MRFLKILLPAAFIMFAIYSCDQDPDYNPTAPTNVTNIDKAGLLSLVNNYRTSGCNCGSQFYAPVQPLVWNDKLASAASGHALDMNNMNNLTHTGSNGSQVGQRVTDQEYAWLFVGENIAQGQTTEQQVVESWIASPEHCQNIMNGDYKDMGVGRSGDFWTQVLAQPK